MSGSPSSWQRLVSPLKSLPAHPTKTRPASAKPGQGSLQEGDSGPVVPQLSSGRGYSSLKRSQTSGIVSAGSHLIRGKARLK